MCYIVNHFFYILSVLVVLAATTQHEIKESFYFFYIFISSHKELHKLVFKFVHDLKAEIIVLLIY